MTQINFMIPVRNGEGAIGWVQEKVDGYLYLGRMSAYVISGKVKKGSQEVELKLETHSQLKYVVLCALKIVSYMTIVMPLIAITMKIVFRFINSFHVGENQFENIPDEMGVEILKYLNGSQLVHCSRVSKQFLGWKNKKPILKVMLITGVQIALNYEYIRSSSIEELISVFPGYLDWQNKILYLYDLHKMIFDIKNSLEKNNFCSLSKKLLTQAVKTPEGKVFDFKALAIELDKNPKKYAFTKKDLRPDFEKMHQVYKDIIQNMEVYIKRGWDRTVRGGASPLAMERQEHLSDNALHLRSILDEGKLHSFGVVQQFCNQEQGDFLKKNRHLSLLFVEGKLTKDEYRVYSKYAKLKSEIKEDYHYNLALKT